MKRILTLIIEGSVVGAVIGFFVAFITQDLILSLAVGVVIGATTRIIIDFVWKKYNQLSGKSFD